MTETVSIDQATAERRVAGTIGMVVAVVLAVILGIHPPGDTSLYDDGIEFTDHVTGYWIAIHLLAAVAFLAIPVVVLAWGSSFDTPVGRVLGRLTGTVAVLGTGVGVIHLAATDTITFQFFTDTLESGATGAETVADGFLRLHAATLTAWIICFWLGIPLFAAITSWFGGRRDWQLWLPVVMVVLLLASLGVSLAERQYTTLSEMGLFRPAATLFIVWLFLIGRRLRRSSPIVAGS